MAVPDFQGTVAEFFDLRGNEVRPDGLADVIPCLVERRCRGVRNMTDIFLDFGDKNVGGGPDPGNRARRGATNPVEHRVVVENRPDNPRPRFDGTANGMGGEERQEVGTAPEVAGPSRLRNETLYGTDREFEPHRHDRTSRVSPNGSIRCPGSIRRSRNLSIGS